MKPKIVITLAFLATFFLGFALLCLVFNKIKKYSIVIRSPDSPREYLGISFEKAV